MKKFALIFMTVCLFPCTAAAEMSEAGGANHTIMLRNDGTLRTWGNNSDGQLGDGTKTNRNVPGQVPNISNVSDVRGGELHTVALRADKTVWCWGSNVSGQLGNGTNSESLMPTEVPKFTQYNYLMIAIAAGQYHSAALRDDGAVFTWGYNFYGQLGTGGNFNSNIPFLAAASAVAIASGNNHILALNNDGTVSAWGYNLYGQLGNGGTTNKTLPVRVRADAGSDFDNVRAIAAGYNHSLALRNDGTLWAWGRNSNGQLGNGTMTNSLYPTKVISADNSDFDNVRSVAVGSNHTIALKNDGTVWVWGDNSKGQLGDGTTTQYRNPIQVLSGVSSIAAGAKHSLAVGNDGSLWAWGDNSYGQLGDRTTAARLTPVRMFVPCDVNSDGVVDLKDVILSLRIAAGITPSETVSPLSDISGDAKIGNEETVYALQVISELR